MLSAQNETGTTLAYQLITVDKVMPLVNMISSSNSITALEGQGTTTIKYRLSEIARMSMSIFDTNDRLVRNLDRNSLRNIGENRIKWDGKNNNGLNLGDALYILKLQATDRMNLQSVERTLNIRIERSVPTISGVSDAPDAFRVTGSSLNTIKYRISEDARVDVRVFDSNNVLLKTLFVGQQLTGVNTVTWDGKNAKGALVPEGVYTYKINARDIAGKLAETQSGTITVDRKAPTFNGVTIDPATATLSDSTEITVSFTLSEPAKVSAVVLNSANKVVRTLLSLAQLTTDPQTVTWDGRDTAGGLVPAGVYNIRFSAVDAAGWRSADAIPSVTLTE
jgi:flagellar hook assembly protein FlgD